MEVLDGRKKFAFGPVFLDVHMTDMRDLYLSVT
jgi:hypothetical protein